MTAASVNLVIEQGATFSKTLSWFGGGKVCKLIGSLTPGCPTQIQITSHGIPDGSVPVFISHVKGATRVNTKPGAPVLSTYIDVDNFFVDADTVGQTYTASTGLVTYYAPTDLTGYTARMHIREEVDSTTPIIELTSTGGDITLDVLVGKITVTISATVTATFTFETAVFDIELEDGSGEVTRIAEGEVTLSTEVTR